MITFTRELWIGQEPKRDTMQEWKRVFSFDPCGIGWRRYRFFTPLNKSLTDFEWKELTTFIGSTTTRTIPVDASEIHEILLEGFYSPASGNRQIRVGYVYDAQTVLDSSYDWVYDVIIANVRTFGTISISGTTLTVSSFTTSQTGNTFRLKYR